MNGMFPELPIQQQSLIQSLEAGTELGFEVEGGKYNFLEGANIIFLGLIF